MKSRSHPQSGVAPLAFLTRLLLALSLTSLGRSSDSCAQTPAAPPDAGPQALPAPTAPVQPAQEEDPFGLRNPFELPQIPVRTPQGAEPFVDGKLKGNDAVFEVIVGQGRILTTKEDITAGGGQPLIAVGDPTVIEFAVITARQLRITGQRVGVTDLSITNAAGKTFTFEVHVVTDLEPLSAKLKSVFPDANLRLSHLRDNVVVEGQARDAAQVTKIMQTIYAYLRSVQAGQARKIQGSQAVAPAGGPLQGVPTPPAPMDPNNPTVAAPPTNPALSPGVATGDLGGPLQVEGEITPAQVINLIRLPGSQQVLLKVRVAELNRSALRRIGANFLGIDPGTGAIVGSQIAGSNSAAGAIGTLQLPQVSGGNALRGAALLPVAPLTSTGGTTVFGIFQDKNFEFTLNALRHNAMLKILAEPNLVALHGHAASFLAGGEFPVPVPQVSAGGATPTITVRFKEFGVRLNFLPYIIDGNIVRLSVAPEVSQIDFTIATTLVQGGSPVPGLNTRKAQTTVELREGQTLAIAGLLQMSLSGNTDRIPGLGDLPIIGPFFSNTSSERVEKELVVLVTPYLVEGMSPEQVPPSPGDEVNGPNDLELFFLNRIEGRTGKDFRATTTWDDPFHLARFLKLEKKYANGPSGFSD